MALFRINRFIFYESLETTVIVKNLDDLWIKIYNIYAAWIDPLHHEKTNINNFDIKIYIPYNLSLEDSFDPRCGWYTHYVSTDYMIKDEFHIVGYLSEPL